MPVIGFLGGGSPDTDANRVRALRRGLSEIGFVEGKNVASEYSVIAALGGRASAQAAKALTTSIPIVFETAVDPVEFGLNCATSWTLRDRQRSGSDRDRR
jgi:putative ABC transport system substrate-binding protein